MSIISFLSKIPVDALESAKHFKLGTTWAVHANGSLAKKTAWVRVCAMQFFSPSQMKNVNESQPCLSRMFIFLDFCRSSCSMPTFRFGTVYTLVAITSIQDNSTFGIRLEHVFEIPIFHSFLVQLFPIFSKYIEVIFKYYCKIGPK